MRVAHVFNLNNDAYNIVKYMRRAGMEADLILNKQDFGMAFPQWEEGRFRRDADPYALSRRDLWTLKSLPPWVKVWDQNRFGQGIFGLAASRIGLYRLARSYDILEAHAPFAIYAQFLSTPYLVYDAGWIRYFPTGNTPRDKLARRGYAKAKAVLVTNPDTFFIFDAMPYVKRKIFMPFVIDTEIYRPRQSSLKSKFQCDFLLFAPARQIWREKGNDKMLQGYAKFVKSQRRPNCMLLMVDWGEDAERSKTLLSKLGLSRHVRLIKPVHKTDLVRYYNAADVVLDQFMLGSYGTSAPEAMACRKPVIMYYSEPAFLRSFGEMPPLLNAYSPDEIFEQIQRCTKSELRLRVGAESRAWVEKHHSWQLVVNRHRQLYSFALGEIDWEEVSETSSVTQPPPD